MKFLKLPKHGTFNLDIIGGCLIISNQGNDEFHIAYDTFFEEGSELEYLKDEVDTLRRINKNYEYQIESLKDILDIE